MLFATFVNYNQNFDSFDHKVFNVQQYYRTVLYIALCQEKNLNKRFRRIASSIAWLQFCVTLACLMTPFNDVAKLLSSKHFNFIILKRLY